MSDVDPIAVAIQKKQFADCERNLLVDMSSAASILEYTPSEASQKHKPQVWQIYVISDVL